MIKARVAKASEAAKKDAEAIREYKDQVGEYRKTVQTLHMEIDSLRSAVSLQFLYQQFSSAKQLFLRVFCRKNNIL